MASYGVLSPLQNTLFVSYSVYENPSITVGRWGTNDSIALSYAVLRCFTSPVLIKLCPARLDRLSMMVERAYYGHISLGLWCAVQVGVLPLAQGLVMRVQRFWALEPAGLEVLSSNSGNYEPWSN